MGRLFSNKRKRPFVLALLVLAMAGGVVLYATGPVTKARFLGWFPKRPVPLAPSLDLPVIRIQIKPKDFEKLAFDRRQAVKYKRFDPSLAQSVAAVIRTHKHEQKAAIKLKGIYPDHWSQDNRWSLAVNLKKQTFIHGEKQFALMPPAARDYGYEWLYIKALKHENLPAPLVRFVRLHVNGQDLGLFLLQEQWRKEALIRNHLPLGPIVGFDKDPWITAMVAARKKGQPFDKDPGFGLAPLKVIGAKRTPEHENQAAITQLMKWRNGEVLTSAVFDLEQTAKFFALRAVMGSCELDWMDMRFYYHPQTQKLIPLGKEVAYRNWLGDWWRGVPKKTYHQAFAALFFSDPVFVASYKVHLKRMADPVWLRTFWDPLQNEMAQKERWLHSLWPGFSFQRHAFENRGRLILEALPKPFEPCVARPDPLP